MKTLRFHFDFLSPYAYLAWTQIHALAERAPDQPTVEPVPVVFAVLLNTHGMKGPAEVPQKRKYVMKDVLRSAVLLGVPLAPPRTHPFNPLLALRVASLPLPPGDRRAIIDRLFAASWARSESVEDPAAVAAMLDELGLKGAALVTQATTDEGKERLRAQTDRALDAGVFGVPSIIVSDASGSVGALGFGELFWGLDSLPHLERHLRGEDPVTRLNPAQLAELQSITPSATRR